MRGETLSVQTNNTEAIVTNWESKWRPNMFLGPKPPLSTLFYCTKHLFDRFQITVPIHRAGLQIAGLRPFIPAVDGDQRRLAGMGIDIFPGL